MGKEYTPLKNASPTRMNDDPGWGTGSLQGPSHPVSGR